jgi:hypothetical protein
VLALAALVAGGVRWVVQGSGNIYTALDKSFYVPGAVTDWELGQHHRMWLGLDALISLAMSAAIAGGLGWLARRRERRTGRRDGRTTLMRAAAWAVAIAAAAIPAFAFWTGGRPPSARDHYPAIAAAASPAAAAAGSAPTGAVPEAGPPAPAISGALDLPSGRYEVVAHPSSAITARLKAGGDSFDARFAEGITGAWLADPKDLTRPMTAEVTADAAGVDTGIDARSKHAREGYLRAKEFPRIGWKLDRLVAARPTGAGPAAAIAFTAAGSVSLIGKVHAVEVTGTLKRADAAALDRLAMKGASILIVQAQLSLVIRETALAKDARDFDGDRIPIAVSLVLRHTGDR